MSRVRPSLILHADIDEREYNDDLVASLKRSYAYVSPMVVASHEPAADDVENVLRYDIRMYRAYWDESDPEAAAQWDEVMPKWLHNMFYKVSSTITASNKMSSTHRTKPLYFAWTELQFGDNVTFAFKTKEDCSLDDTYLEFVQQGRRLMNDGTFGSDVAAIRIPSRASYEQQKLAIIEEQRRKAEEEAAAAAAQDEEHASEIPVDADQDAVSTTNDGESPTGENALTTSASAAVAGKSAQQGDEGDAADAGEAIEASEEEQAEPELPHVNFDPDTTIWGIEYADGSVREYDSSAGAFV